MDNTREEFDRLRPLLIKDKGCICVNCQKDCGSDVLYHHIVPLSIGGTNNISNIVPVCENCDGLIHSIDRTHWRALQKAGIERAKLEGKYQGRKPMALDREQFTAMVQDYRAGKRTAKSISAELGISNTTLYRKIKDWGL